MIGCLFLKANPFCSYNVISSILSKYGLIIKHGKTDAFHFTRSHETYNPPPLDLTPIGGPSLLPKETWRYLDFIFDHKLTFRSHLDFYSNKVIFIGVALFPYHYIDFSCGITTKHLHTIILISWERCNEELLYGLLEPFKCLFLWALKP